MQQSVCDWLEARKGVKVQQNWVEACLEWIEQEEARNNCMSIPRRGRPLWLKFSAIS